MYESAVLLKRSRVITFMLILLLPAGSFAQRLTLEKVYSLSRENYPLIKQKDLINRTASLNISNINKGFLPQLSFNGQASYQSDVTKIDVHFPGIDIPFPDKDQYRLTADLDQLIYDGGMSKQQKTLQQLQLNVSQQQLEVELYKLKDRISQVYLGILYLDEQIKQVKLVKEDLNTGISKVEAQLENGVAFRSSLNLLKAELIKADQHLVELHATRKGFIETLSLFINQPLNDSAILERPAPPPVTDTAIERPEIKLYNDRSVMLDRRNKLIRAKNLPRTSLFLQGGYGRPGLNLLKNEFDFFISAAYG
jgi:outer membrane protein TolC